MLQPTLKVDSHNWLQGQILLRQNSKTLPGEALARAVGFVVKDARDHTPFVTMGKIDTELAVEVIPMIGARGKPLKNKKFYKTSGLGQRRSPDAHPSVPLTWLIIGARAKPGSNYNQITGGRWQISGGHPFKGHSVSEFGSIMAKYIDKMVKGRHSGTHFFQASWGPVLAALAPLVPQKYKDYFSRIAGKKAFKETRIDIGTAQLTGAGTTQATLKIENRVGMSGEYPGYDQQVNAAAHRVLEPVLQRAIDANYIQQMQEAGRRGLLDSGPALRSMGFNVS